MLTGKCEPVEIATASNYSVGRVVTAYHSNKGLGPQSKTPGLANHPRPQQRERPLSTVCGPEGDGHMSARHLGSESRVCVL